MKKNILKHLPFIKRFFLKKEFNIESYLVYKYGFVKSEKVGILRMSNNNLEIFINYKTNYIYLLSGKFLFLKINFIPKTQLIVDLIIHNSLENIKKNVNLN